eukprot:TRINITY_DN1096_c0_g1_i10.p2 TRINITY_DN1096_c0_g1~~TRINITY_DN1096_c0_g1_i10.p2  ORF type:complete len:420 (+),score=28.37 TRINITY_DN1096_c0_g1_i10:71-1261(+)
MTGDMIKTLLQYHPVAISRRLFDTVIQEESFILLQADSCFNFATKPSQIKSRKIETAIATHSVDSCCFLRSGRSNIPFVTLSSGMYPSNGNPIPNMDLLEDESGNFGSLGVSSQLAPIRDPTNSFTFDAPSLPILATSIAPAAAPIVSPATTINTPVAQQSLGAHRVPSLGDASPRSHFGGTSFVSNSKILHSASPSFSSSVGLNLDESEFLNNADPQQLQVLIDLLQQAQSLNSVQTPSLSAYPSLGQNSNGYSSLLSPRGSGVPQGAGLPFAMPVASTPQPSEKYKTEVCRLWQKDGFCRFGDGCHFAHGMHELQPLMRHPKYKTKLCRNYASTGKCDYGQRCQFIHQIVPSMMPPMPNIPDIQPLPANNALSSDEQELARVIQIQEMLTKLDL